MKYFFSQKYNVHQALLTLYQKLKQTHSQYFICVSVCVFFFQFLTTLQQSTILYERTLSLIRFGTPSRDHLPKLHFTLAAHCSLLLKPVLMLCRPFKTAVMAQVFKNPSFFCFKQCCISVVPSLPDPPIPHLYLIKTEIPQTLKSPPINGR